MLQPANFSISRLSSTKAKPSSSASIRPSVLLPAPRRPTSAIRGLCVVPRACPLPVPSISATATRTRCSVVSSRLSSSSRSSSHSGFEVVMSPVSSARLHCKAPATCNSTRMLALPTPYSRLARWRSLTSAASATALRVMPRRARKPRTRSPSATRNGFFSSAAAGLSEVRSASFDIVFDMRRRHWVNADTHNNASFAVPQPCPQEAGGPASTGNRASGPDTA